MEIWKSWRYDKYGNLEEIKVMEEMGIWLIKKHGRNGRSGKLEVMENMEDME